jgi:hypothetical protein
MIVVQVDVKTECKIYEMMWISEYYGEQKILAVTFLTFK